MTEGKASTPARFWRTANEFGFTFNWAYASRSATAYFSSGLLPKRARGLDRRLAQETRFPVYVAEDPLLCVVKGTGEVLEEAKMLQKVQSALASRKPPSTRRHLGI